jgi:hypothetical protein
MVRGTIVEIVPNESVTILLVNGSTRTFRYADTVYVGPAASEPASAPAPPMAAQPTPPAPPAAHANTAAQVRLEGVEPGLTFHHQTSSVQVDASWGWNGVEGRGYDRLCTAPCSASIPPGSHRFALTRLSSPRVAESDDDIPVKNGDIVQGRYESRLGTRIAGYILMPASIVTGIALIGAGALGSRKTECSAGGNCVETPDVKIGLMATGLAIIPIGSLIGILLMRAKDSASFEVIRSVSLGPSPSLSGTSPALDRTSWPRGATLRANF